VEGISAASSFLSHALDLLLPRHCALCGRLFASPTRRDGSAPVEAFFCPECQGRLKPIQGRRCRGCGKELVSEDGICMRCRARTWSFDAAFPLFAYRDEAEDLVAAYKFAGRRSLARLFASLFEEALRESWPGWPLVPVPFRREKLRKKGWDQVEDLAVALERRGFEVRRILERLPSGEQKRLSLEERLGNACKAYRLKAGAEVPREAVLIDDVFTTGATAEACARALKEGGALHVAFLSIAAD
jgi:ComF family protein